MLFFVLLFCCRLKKSKGRSERIGEKKRGGRGRNETREREKKPPPTVFLTVACLGGDLERVVGDGVHIRVGVLGAALALASGELDLVGAGAEGLLLRGLGLEGQAHLVDLVGLEAGGDQLGVAEGEAGCRGEDVHGDGGGGGLVQPLDGDLNGELGAGGARLGGHGGAQDLGALASAVVHGALLGQQLAEVDGVQVGLLDDGNELLDAHNVAQKVARNLLQLEQRRLGGKGGASQQEDGHEGEDDLVHCSTFLSLSLADGVSVCLVFVSRP